MRAHVLPDLDHPNMWRVRWPNGEYSDMVNLSRARDAVATREIAEANAKKKAKPATIVEARP